MLGQLQGFAAPALLGRRGTDAADRRAVPGDTVVWLPADGAPSPVLELRGRTQAGSEADGQDGAGADPPAAADERAAS
jgi:hypothetical protein